MNWIVHNSIGSVELSACSGKLVAMQFFRQLRAANSTVAERSKFAGGNIIMVQGVLGVPTSAAGLGFLKGLKA